MTIKKTKLALQRETLVELERGVLTDVAGGVAPVPKTMYCPKSHDCCTKPGAP
jgi:hypothetical protein